MDCPHCGSASRRFGKDRHGHQRYQCLDCFRTFTEPHYNGGPLGLMRLDLDQALDCLKHILEGVSIRSTERLLGVHRDRIVSAVVNAGENCQHFLEIVLRDVEAQDIQVDEMWGFVFCKEKTRVRREYGDERGDAYCFVGIERHHKMVLAWHLGKRCPEDALAFSEKLRRATAGRFQVTTDGFTPYRTAIPQAFGWTLPFAQLIKQYRTAEEADRRYTPPRVAGIDKIVGCGDPDMDRACTSHVERGNLTMRMMNRRLTRLTNGHSKKWENHEAALALYFAYYNFCRVHMTLKETPAMAAGLVSEPWTLKRLLNEAAESVKLCP